MSNTFTAHPEKREWSNLPFPSSRKCLRWSEGSTIPLYKRLYPFSSYLQRTSADFASYTLKLLLVKFNQFPFHIQQSSSSHSSTFRPSDPLPPGWQWVYKRKKRRKTLKRVTIQTSPGKSWSQGLQLRSKEHRLLLLLCLPVPQHIPALPSQSNYMGLNANFCVSVKLYFILSHAHFQDFQ